VGRAKAGSAETFKREGLAGALVAGVVDDDVTPNDYRDFRMTFL
jgi:hypothetical protein